MIYQIEKRTVDVFYVSCAYVEADSEEEALKIATEGEAELEWEYVGKRIHEETTVSITVDRVLDPEEVEVIRS